MRARSFFACFLFFYCHATGQPHSDLYDLKVQKLKDGIFLIYRPQPLRHFVEGNVTVIINDKDVILVDGGGSPTSANNILAEVKKLTDKPIRYVINTHPHVDHTLGNQVYAAIPGVEIVSHSETKKDMIVNGIPYVKGVSGEFDNHKKRFEAQVEKIRSEKKPGYEQVLKYMNVYYEGDMYVRKEEYARSVITPATLLVDQEMILVRGDRTINIKFIGEGDTEGDLIVYLPNEKIICSGDMVVHPVPYGFSSGQQKWIRTLMTLSQMDFDMLVPGHGEVQNGKSYVYDLIRLLDAVRTQVKNGVDKGVEKETIKKDIDLKFFSNTYFPGNAVADYRFFTWFINPAVEVAYEDFKKK